MKYTTEWLGCLALLSFLGIQFAVTSGCCQNPPEGVIKSQKEVPVSRDWSSSDSDSKNRKAFNQKIDPVFFDIIQSAKKSGTVSPDMARQKSLKISGNRVQVEITTWPEYVEQAKKAIEAVDGKVTGVSMSRKAIQSWVPVPNLESLAEEKSILYIRSPAYAVPLSGN